MEYHCEYSAYNNHHKLHVNRQGSNSTFASAKLKFPQIVRSAVYYRVDFLLSLCYTNNSLDQLHV